MVLKFESHIDFTSFNREKLSYLELLECMKLFKKAIKSTSHKYLQKHLCDEAYFFFCYKYISPELENIKVIKKFLSNKENRDALDELCDYHVEDEWSGER